MADDPHATLDNRLSKAFEADPRAASRVAREALTAYPTARRRGRLAVVSAAAIACMAAAVALWPPGPATEVGRGEFPSGTLTDGLLVIPLPDGSVAISGGEARRGRPDDGYGIVIVEGELR